MQFSLPLVLLVLLSLSIVPSTIPSSSQAQGEPLSRSNRHHPLSFPIQVTPRGELDCEDVVVESKKLQMNRFHKLSCCPTSISSSSRIVHHNRLGIVMSIKRNTPTILYGKFSWTNDDKSVCLYNSNNRVKSDTMNFSSKKMALQKNTAITAAFVPNNTYNNDIIRRTTRHQVLLPFVSSSTQRNWMESSSNNNNSFHHRSNHYILHKKNRPSLELCLSSSCSSQIRTNTKYFHQSTLVNHHSSTRCYSSSTTKTTTTSSSIPDETKDNPPNNIKKEKEEDIYKELEQLSKLIRYHDTQYYTSGLQPLITDDEYDALTIREAELCEEYPHVLKRLEEESGLGIQVSRYGGRVGPIVEEVGVNTDLKHEEEGGVMKKDRVDKKKSKLFHIEGQPMQSLNNAMTANHVTKWLNRVRKTILSSEKIKEEAKEEAKEEEKEEAAKNSLNQTTIMDVIAEPKMDGLSISLRYELADSHSNNGQKEYVLKWASTRGDGKRGEDVTDAIMEIIMDSRTHHTYDANSEAKDGLIPKSFSLKSTNDESQFIEVRGEVVLPTSTFQDLTNSSSVEQSSCDDDDDDDDNNDDDSIDIDESKTIKGNTTSLLSHQFSNARNAASGILMRRKDISELTEQEIENTKLLRSYLRFYAYSVAFSGTAADSSHDDDDAMESYYKSGLELRQLLENLDFSVPNPVKVVQILMDRSEEVVDSECQELFDFHESIMSSRGINGISDAQNDEKKSFDFDVDGAVYKVSSTSDRALLGSSSRAPRWAIAHKFPAQSAVTKLRGVEVQIGRTGAMTPVAILDPVDLGGVTVSRASLHNFQYAQSILNAQSLDDSSEEDDSSDLGGSSQVGVFAGASVLVSRAGDVIPQVLQRLDDKTSDIEERESFISLLPPHHCPACGSETIFDVISSNSRKTSESDLDTEILKPDELETNSTAGNMNQGNTTPIEGTSTKDTMGQVLRCGGPQLLCPPRAVSALAHTFSRGGLDITGLSEARLDQLLEAKLIQIPSDLFNILDEDHMMMESTMALPGWGEKSAKKLQDAVQNVATNGVSLSRFIYSLGIRHVGQHSSQLIANAYGSLSSFYQDIDNVANMEDVDKDNDDDDNENMPFVKLSGTKDEEGVKGIGPVIIQSLVVFSRNKELVDASKKLASKLNVHDEQGANDQLDSQEMQEGKPWSGKVVVFTGTLPDKLSRSQAQIFAIDTLGAKSTPGSVSKATDLLVEGEKGGKKVQKAIDLGVEVISAEEFVAILNDQKTKK